MNIKSIFIFLIVVGFFSGCYKLQKDYQYVPYVLDSHINETAKEFLLSRGSNGTGSDTAFKWMQLGIEYAGIDLAEYEKPGRTYIFLHNSAIKVLTSGKVSGGFFFDNPIVVKDSSGTPIKSKIDPTIDSTRPAISWNEYSKQTVKNYLLYLIIPGEFGFDNLVVSNTSVQTLLPANSVIPYTDSRFAWIVTKTTPNPDVTATTFITTAYPTGGTGFDPEGKMNLKIGNNENSPIVVNDRTNDRTAGYIATNGQIHVFGATVFPCRYSW